MQPYNQALAAASWKVKVFFTSQLVEKKRKKKKKKTYKETKQAPTS
jgi:hypothetical protein